MRTLMLAAASLLALAAAPASARSLDTEVYVLQTGAVEYDVERVSSASGGRQDVVQSGQDHRADQRVENSAEGHRQRIDQDGARNEAVQLVHGGAGNDQRAIQSGTDNRARQTVRDSDSNLVYVAQTGAGHYALQEVLGGSDFNRQELRQFDAEQYAEQLIDDNAIENVQVALQRGDGNRAFQSVAGGGWNSQAVEQDGSGNEARQSIVGGDYNIQRIIQSGSGNVASQQVN